jgi:hypothetical protein
MPIKVPLGTLGMVVVEEVKAKSALEYKAYAFEIFSQIIQKTPVDTGRARANWNISAETPDYSTTKSTQPDLDLNLDVGDFPNVYISNGLDYVADLEDGKSWRQAPAGIITPALAAARANRRR